MRDKATQPDGRSADAALQQTLPGFAISSDVGLRHESELPFGPSLLALGKVHGLGNKGLSDLVSHLGGEIGLLLEDDHARALNVLQAVKIPSAHRVADALAEDREDLISAGRQEFDRLSERSVVLLAPGEIPSRLRALPDGPLWLFVQGCPEVLDHGPFVAVVGTREPSPLGVKATEAVVRTMAAYPITLVSGLANGIDGAAHRFALRDSVPNVAFLGHGINVIFPAETSEIRQRIIASGGAVATEYLPDEHYKKHYFVARNRLQAGLSDVVVAADGTATGGTAHTVRFATKYARSTVGLHFDGAGTLAKLVAEQPAGEVLEIFEDGGRQRLDHLFRALCAEMGRPTNALTLVERLLDREVRLRHVSRGDLEHLTAQLARLIEEAS